MSNDTFRYANAETSRQPVYMRDVTKYEQELATSQADPDNLDTLPDENSVPKDPSASHDWEKRYSDLKSYTDKKVNEALSTARATEQKNLELQQKLKEAESKPKSYPVSDSEIEAWAESFPDFYKTMVTIIEKKQDAKADELRQEMGRFEDTQKAYAAEKGRAELLKLHPDAYEIGETSQFKEWYATQEPRVQALIDSPNPNEISKGLHLYKSEAGIKPVQKTDSAKAASQAVTVDAKPDTPKGKKVWRESEVDRMTTRQYMKHEAEIDLARAEGRFEYDMSSF